MLVMVLPAVASAFVYGAAAVAQERAAAGGATGAAAWRLSVPLNLLGAGLHIWALGYGPLTVVQTLGALTLVAAPLLSQALRHRRMNRQQWTGIALTVAGMAGLLLLGRSARVNEALSTGRILAVVGITAAVLGISAVARAVARRPVVVSLWFAAAAGVAFGASSTLAQALALALGGEGARISWLPALLVAAVVAALACAGLLTSQLSYKAGLEAPLATVTLVNPAYTAMVGFLVLGERYVTGIPSGLLAAATALAVGRGVYVLAHAPAAPRAVPVAADRTGGGPKAASVV
ncbi:hypothetical protein [Streptomyces sp. NPDC048603]|uniref:hypothetical protein n=1 Tax=Streptomyces sp. NPDC048603 TaxID=3365577 RepID=UPI003714615C